MAAVTTMQSKFLRATEFAMSPQSIHVIGTPRQSTLFHRPRSSQTSAVKGSDTWVMFIPTYRKSRRSTLNVDNVFSVAQQEATLAELNEVVRASEGVLWVRPHPVAEPFPQLPPTIRLATDEKLEQHGVTLYDMLAATDLLITDYSSVWVDFLATDKPMLGFCPDIEEYRSARGLALEPYDAWFPGRIARTPQELCDNAQKLLRGEDDERDKRAWVKSLLGPTRPDAARDYWSVLLGG